MALERDVEVIRKVVAMGRALREKHRIKTRQPLRGVRVVTHFAAERDAILQHAELVAGELNVKDVDVTNDDAAFSDLSFKANFKTLGKRFGASMKQAADAISKFSNADFAALQRGENLPVLDQTVTLEDVLVVRNARADVVCETEGHLTVALESQLDDELIAEGLARETVSLVQKLRKDLGLAVVDRIALRFVSPSAILIEALKKHRNYLQDEVLAKETSFAVGETLPDAKQLNVEEYPLLIVIQKA